MKKFYFLSIAFSLCISLAFSQDEIVKDTTWKTGGVVSVNLTQAYYKNWQAGGVPSVAGVGFFKSFAIYEKGKWRWGNLFDFAYGLISEREKKMKKTDDKIQIDSKLGYNIGKKWYVSFLGSFRSQFTPGYEDAELQIVKISDFMAPAYVMTSFG